MEDDGHQLGLLCAELTELRDLASRHGLSRALDSLLTAVRAGQQVRDRRIELLRRLGIPAGTTRQPGLRIPGLGDGRPATELYGCPEARCSRTWVRPPGDPVALCSVYGAPLSHRPFGS
ncbi:hypothetical protein [Streptosporangium sp. KLBMP 9127]|nr:hypothetical protein [Streptosporangium sp. KLBMP 9127]